MTRAELEAAIARVIDAERHYTLVTSDDSRTGAIIVARREMKDAHADLNSLLGVLNHELAFTP